MTARPPSPQLACVLCQRPAPALTFQVAGEPAPRVEPRICAECWDTHRAVLEELLQADVALFRAEALAAALAAEGRAA